MIEPLEEVQMVETPQQAARLRLEFEHLLAKPNQDPDFAADLRDGIRELDRRWPTAEHEGLIATEQELGGLGGELRAHRQRRRRDAGVDATEAARRRRQREHPASSKGGPRRSATQGQTPRRGRTSSASSSRAGRGVTRRAADVTGATQLAATTTDLVLMALRTGLGLALLYLILSPKGTKGLSGALNGVSSIVNLLIAPVDPLGGGGRRAPTSAAGVPILQPGETKAHFDKRLGDYLQGRAQTPARPTSGAGVLGAPNLGGFPQTVTGKSPTSSVITDRQHGGHL